MVHYRYLFIYLADEYDKIDGLSIVIGLMVRCCLLMMVLLIYPFTHPAVAVALRNWSGLVGR